MTAIKKMYVIDKSLSEAAANAALRGDAFKADYAEIKLLEAHMLNMEEGSEDHTRALGTISKIRKGERRYSLEILPACQMR